ncbi:MAG: SpoIIE family protein phosphatase, partial [Leptolyngbya sp. SIO4C5]|nr:SpoIIE family protein phosphatase [Leptolyngbya sp. SIO4C5]
CNLGYAIARILSNAAETSAAIHRSLQALCGSLGFQFGEFWQMDTSQQKLKCRERWYPNIPSLEEFADFTKTLALEPNEGIPGQSWQSDEPVWVENIFQNDAFVRKQAAERAGFSSVLSCPVSQGIEKLGVIVLFSQMASPPEHDLLRLLTILGRQLSQYMKRKQAEQQIQQQNQLLQSELLQAAKYVESLLPKDSKQFSAGSKAEPSLILRTLFQPSSTLGGDAFDYVWLDSEHLMFHLLDVAGHGVKSALLSVSVLNILRQRTLQNADFYQPDTVLQALNDVFQVNEEGEDYFTCWYGVYNTVSRELTFATAGHPPGVLIMPTDEGWQTQCLDSDGIAIGLFPGMPFEAKKITVLPQSRLYLFSDGVFEIATGKKGEIWGFNAWKEFLRKYTEEQSSSLKPLLTKAQMLNKSSILEDDFSVLEVNFA